MAPIIGGELARGISASICRDDSSHFFFPKVAPLDLADLLRHDFPVLKSESTFPLDIVGVVRYNVLVTVW